ncbi:MAG: dimethylsulfonioproprionate lyase family protein [Pseudomonadota bacterium]
MTSPAFEALLETARETHEAAPALREFCDFPNDLEASSFMQYRNAATDLMLGETGWPDAKLHPLAEAFLKAGPEAHWRETYKGTRLGQIFLDNFACYCLIGPDAPWKSQQMFGFVIYMPPKFWYTWHHHPAEEMYFVLAGQGEFCRQDRPSEHLRAGEAMFHASNESHALRTHDSPIMAYVLWRNHFDTKPVLTEGIGDETRPIRAPS